MLCCVVFCYVVLGCVVLCCVVSVCFVCCMYCVLLCYVLLCVYVDVRPPNGSQLVLFPLSSVLLLLPLFAERCVAGMQGSLVLISL